MMQAVRIISLLTRLALMAVMVLGLLFWLAQIAVVGTFVGSGLQTGLRYVHIGLGIIGTVGLLGLAGIALFKRGTRALAAIGILYALIMLAFGLTQMFILSGNLHLIIQLAHLLVGIGAMYLARAIERRYQGSRAQSPERAVARSTSTPALQGPEG
ncbi:hypothetical protein EPA93_34220 [Ktedonosporobacter rubrisoli]|uniref:Uncharacterized protein n=1 Tax=Ktedonosporobacter rubrisoli TaxID=2509675 RepID=A0A4P6JYV5_KTERU|nr:hypothetical protein [Ktedonosporobacter rubrisoli]QBD80755.1 hypothetical protein EPA93_34220 [Ktedonosporobacter rubrisoli]